MNNSDDGLRKKFSGYSGNVDDWRRFLSCWYRQYVREEQDLNFSLIKRDVLGDSVDLAASEGSYQKKIDERQAALGVRFPMSYVHFLLAYQPEESYPADGDDLNSYVRMVRVDELTRTESVLPELVRAGEEAAAGLTTGDAEYYVYGPRQDSVAIRPEYLGTSLLVGWHGFDHYEIVVLHPKVLTADGEMEAVKYDYVGAVRTVNFAELMRQTYRRQVLNWSRPPAEHELRSTCAGMLPMDSWWSAP
jgi:hypothetical protein